MRPTTPDGSIVCGESSRELAKLAPESVDLVVTSPPYGDLRTYNGFRFDFAKIANALVRAIKPGGVIVWVCNDQTVAGSETGTSFRQALGFMERGLRLHDTMIFAKTNAVFPDTERYYAAFEYMFVFSKSRPAAFNPIADRPNKHAGSRLTGNSRCRTGGMKVFSGYGKVIQPHGVRLNVWKVPTGCGKSAPDPLWKEHPATFPLRLARDHVVSWSNPGDLVVDPFSGSGTTCVAAMLEGRRFLGIDMSAEYCRLARKRLAWYRERQFAPKDPELAAA